MAARRFTCLIVCTGLLQLSSVLGASVDSFYPYGIGLDESLDIGDDLSSDKFTLDMPIVYFGERRYDLWVR